jgi:predicted transcriptional regulator
MKFSEKAMAVRDKLYVSQKQLADEIGVSFSTVKRSEKGHHEPSFIAQKRFDGFCNENNYVCRGQKRRITCLRKSTKKTNRAHT